jgi:hypothetical protein
MFNIKETALKWKSETLTPSMEQIQPNSAHSSSNYNSASMIGLAHSWKTTKKSTSPSLISRALRLLTLRIPSSTRTYFIHQPGEMTTEHSSWSWTPTSELWMWSVKPKPNLKTYPWNQLTVLPSISSSLIDSLRSPVGIAAHSDISSTVDFQPASRMRCHTSVNLIRFLLSELWHSQ